MHANQGLTQDAPVRIGASSLRMTERHTCIVKYVGVLDEGVIDQMNKALLDVGQKLRPLYLIVDLSRVSTVTQLGRQRGAGGMLTLNPAATAVIGATFHIRVVVEMITRAAKLLNTGLAGPVEFFANDKEAQAWINQLHANQERMH